MRPEFTANPVPLTDASRALWRSIIGRQPKPTLKHQIAEARAVAEIPAELADAGREVHRKAEPPRRPSRSPKRSAGDDQAHSAERSVSSGKPMALDPVRDNRRSALRYGRRVSWQGSRDSGCVLSGSPSRVVREDDDRPNLRGEQQRAADVEQRLYKPEHSLLLFGVGCLSLGRG